MKNRRWLLRVTAVALFQSCRAPVQAIVAELQQIAPDDLRQRGIELRAALDQTYRKLVDEHKLKPFSNDVREVVERFIPIGTTFDDAETILRVAGFKVDPRPGSVPSRVNIGGVGALIEPYDRRPFTSIDLSVVRMPKSPGDYSTVSRISAGIVVTGL